MEEKDIEQKLKRSADKIETKSFSERWENIKESILIEDNKREVLAEDAILATIDGTTTHNVNTKKKNFLIAVLSLLVSCFVVLAIVLSLTLKKNGMEFFDSSDLAHPTVSKEQFYDDIKNAKYDIIDLSKYDIYAYSIFTINENLVKGGGVEIANEEKGYYLNIIFYDKTVKITEPILYYEKYEVKSIEISYYTKMEDEIYSTYAYVEYNELHYQIDYLSIEDDCKSLFQELFS